MSEKTNIAWVVHSLSEKDASSIIVSVTPTDPGNAQPRELKTHAWMNMTDGLLQIANKPQRKEVSSPNTILLVLALVRKVEVA